MSKYKTTHPSPNEIDRLRFKAFSTNRQEDVTAYYKAASLYFQARDVREMNRADHIEELEAKLSKSEALLAKAVGALGDIHNGEPEWPDDPQRELDWCRNRAGTTLAELSKERSDEKGQDDE